MDIVRWSIARPVSVTVGVLLLVMFGLIGLTAIPVQLTPTVDRPVITITTDWPGRSPDEVVDEITKEQEERLKNVSNLKSMRSVSREGGAEISMEFTLGTNIDRAMQEVSDRLRQVPSYPDEVDEPVIKAAEGSSSNAIAWIIVDLPEEFQADYPQFDVTTLYDRLDREVKPYFERIDGVAEVNVFGGRDREVRVQVDPTKLAQRSLTYGDVIDALRRTNRNTSAGTIAEGKRDYRVRVVGQYDDPQQVLDTVVSYRDGFPVYVRDVATVDLGYEKKRSFVRSIGHPAIAMNVIRQSGSNVLDIMDELRVRMDDVQRGMLPTFDPLVGDKLRIRQVYDETVYIDSSIALVRQNLIIGGVLAGLVLLIYLRSFVSTGIIALAIPISVVGTFLVLLGLGRTLNVVSLAGLAFATGMVVDNAIVVLENIYRHRQSGATAMQAAYRGGKEVWGAILASTLTTVAVFIPILTIQEEAGQLFRDIALAIVASVTLSLIISITVIPTACARWLGDPNKNKSAVARAFSSLFGLAPALAGLNGFVGGIVRWVITGWRGWTIRPLAIVALTALSVVGAMRLAPPLDYLPAGNQNLVFGFLLIPPGYSVEKMEEIAQDIEVPLEPYLKASLDDPASVEALDPIYGFDPTAEPFEPVPIDNMFIAGFNGAMIAGATSEVPDVVIPIGTLLTMSMQTMDSYGGAQQRSIFQSGIEGGNTVDLELSGSDLGRITDAAGMMFGLAIGKYGPGNLRADPANFSLTQPELRVRVNDAGRELGLTSADVGTAVRALFDGAFVGDYELNGEKVDLMVVPIGDRLEFKEQLTSVPVTTPSGLTVPLDTVVSVEPYAAPQEIRRIEELPSVTIKISPPTDVPLEQTMREIEDEIVGPARAAGLIGPTERVNLEGTAAKLNEVTAALFGDTSQEGPPALARGGRVVSGLLMVAGLVVGVVVLVRGSRRGGGDFIYGAIGAALLAAVLAGLALGVTGQPELVLARFIWALAVTYLLMCALFESFLYPLVIMFTVPLAVVGGFAGLAIVHARTAANPVVQPQQLDVLTMLGFMILIGIVVNNAILIVYQALNFMRGESDDGLIEPMAPADAIVESVRTRMRPIFMTATTSVGGLLPLVLMPGAGSEMYRGLGSVVVGGLIASTVFTLLLVPLVFSLVLQMSEGLRRALGLASGLPHARAESNREMRGGAATPTPAMALSPREDS